MLLIFRLIIGSVFLSACADAVEPGILLGTGEYEFEALGDGDEIDIVYGPQGGYHLLGSIRIKGLEAGDDADLSNESNPTTRFEIIANDMQLVMSPPFTQGYPNVVDDVDWTHEMVGRLDSALTEWERIVM